MLDGLSIGLSAYYSSMQVFYATDLKNAMFHGFIDTPTLSGLLVYVCITPIPNGVLRKGIMLK